jgi:hypothetical protein
MEENKGPKTFLDLPKIPVYGLKFKPGQPQSLPGCMADSSVTSDFKEGNKSKRHTVEYIPQIRHFLVTCYMHDRTERSLVHESVPLNVMLDPEVVER